MTPLAARTMRARTLFLLFPRLACRKAQLLRTRKHPLGRGREQGKSRILELSQQSPRRNAESLGWDEDAESGETLKKGVFTPRGIDSISFIVTETSSFAHAHSTHAHHAFSIFYLFIVLSYVFCVVAGYNIAHRTLYSLVHL